MSLCWSQGGASWEEGPLLIVMCRHFLIQKETKGIRLLSSSLSLYQSFHTVNVIYNYFCSPF